MIKLILIISLLLNIFLAYRVFDLGITTTHQSEQLNYLNAQLGDVEKLWSSLFDNSSRSGVLQAAGNLGMEVIDKPSESAIYVGRIKFILSGDKVTKIILRE